MEKEKGLNRTNRSFITFIVTAILVLFGPIEPYGPIIRIIYLILIPVLLWFFLKHYGGRWHINFVFNDRLNRSLAAGIGGALLVAAVLSWTSSYHAECDQYARSADGYECVGDYVTSKGGDRGGAFTEILFSTLFFWYAVSYKKEENTDIF